MENLLQALQQGLKTAGQALSRLSMADFVYNALVNGVLTADTQLVSTGKFAKDAKTYYSLVEAGKVPQDVILGGRTCGNDHVVFDNGKAKLYTSRGCAKMIIKFLEAGKDAKAWAKVKNAENAKRTK